MGKYMKKSKAAAEVAVMDATQSPLGIRTRAKTLALQRLKTEMTCSSQATSSPSPSHSKTSYLQLRSRMLLKPPIFKPPSKKPKVIPAPTSVQNPNPSPSPSQIPSSGGVSIGESKEDLRYQASGFHGDNVSKHSMDVAAAEDSFGENVMDSEVSARMTRESTPCSLMMSPDPVQIPGSATRNASPAETSRRLRSSLQRHILTSHEMDEFFAVAKEEQRQQFIEKYNFDPVNDKPLPGRYEWERLKP